MKNTHRFGRQLAIAAILSAAAIPDAYSAAPDGAALAETCATCHNTDTNSREGFAHLRGEDHLDALLEMKYRSPEGIMDWVARTYTDAQLRAINEYHVTH
jgi:cytochrome c553